MLKKIVQILLFLFPLLNLYSFEIQNTNLNPIYATLKDKPLNHKFRILVIGDSHIQADIFSGAIRNNLQGQYGNGGRGLVFPPDTPGGGGQRGVKTAMTSGWETTTIRMSKKHKEISHIYNPAMKRYAALKPQASMTVSLTQMRSEPNTINADKRNVADGQNHHRCEIWYIEHPLGETMDVYINKVFYKKISLKASSQKPARMVIRSASPINSLKIISRQKKQIKPSSDMVLYANAPVQILGFVIENDLPGMIIDAAGLNGARIEAPLFIEDESLQKQLKWRDYDLALICFGANDACYRYLFEKDLLDHYKSLAEKIEKAPEKKTTPVIYVTPPDMMPQVPGLKESRRIVQKNLKTINRVIKQAALENGHSVWNQQKAMGGARSVLIWKKQKLFNKDLIHASYAGYNRLAALFTKTLLNSGNKLQ